MHTPPKGSASVTIEAVLVVYLLLQWDCVPWYSNGVTGVSGCSYHRYGEDLALSTSPVPTVFWKRYVDDVLMAVPADQVDGMLAHINSINQNIQFTSGREQGHVIPFLDVTILHNNDGSLSLYQSVL